MFKIFLVFVFIFFFVIPLFAQQVDTAWVRRYNGPGNGADVARDIAVDDSGNVYVTGYSVGSGTYDDYATIKYDPAGNQLWVKRYNGLGNDADMAYAIAVDGSGNVYVTGYSVDNWTSLDYATIKYDPNGNEVWVRSYDAANVFDEATDIAIDGSGNVYVTGRSMYPDTTEYPRYWYATIKYDTNGNRLWVRRYNQSGVSGSEAHAIAVDASGNVFVTGISYTEGQNWDDFVTIKYYTDGGTAWVRKNNINLLGHDSYLWNDIAVDDSGNAYVTARGTTIRYYPNGDSAWVRRDSETYTNAIAVDYSGNVYVTGRERITSLDYSTIKYYPNGDMAWVRRYDGWGADDQTWDIAVDSSGNIYVTGESDQGNTTWLDFGTVKYDSSGNQRWVTTYNGPLSSLDRAYAIAVDGSGNIYVTGGGEHGPCCAETTLDYATIKYVQKDRFRSNPDGWQFGNSETRIEPPYNGWPIMWPRYWWIQFNYTEGKYPPDWRYWASPDDFPDWPLFVETFGKAQCYFDTLEETDKYRKSAVALWKSLVEGKKGQWGGSCFGFAISSLLFYNGLLSLSSTFPDTHYSNVYDVPISDSSRKLVNKYWTYQFGKLSYNHLLQNRSKTPRETLNDLIDMLWNKGQNNKALSMRFGPSAYHTVVPCSLSREEGLSGRYYVHIYDNNYPGVEYAIQIDSLANTWAYYTWGGSKGIFLEDPISNYISYAILSGERSPLEKQSPLEGTSSQYLEVYNPAYCDIMIKNTIGDSIGYVNTDSTLLEDMSDAVPIIPKTGSFHPPIGYYIPQGTYTAQISNNVDTNSYLSVFSDSNVFVYDRHDFQPNQIDHLMYSDNAKQFQVKTDDPELKTISLKSIKIQLDREMVCDLENLTLSQQDSIKLEIVDQSLFKLTNTGSEKVYKLTLELASADLSPIFVHDSIAVSKYSSHQISPNWEQIDTLPVPIHIDNDLDGIFDDTLVLENEYFVRGDVNRDRKLTVSDVVYLINYLFKGGPAPIPVLEAGDVNCDGHITVTDVVYLINYLFKGGPPQAC